MWAFFYYDKTRETSYLCRDRFGEKPLFYMRKLSEFYFWFRNKIYKMHV